MKILIINGSPRKKGLISQMLGIMQAEAEQRGGQVQLVYTNDLTIKPCIGCMACRTKLKCSISEDDSQRVLNLDQKPSPDSLRRTLMHEFVRCQDVRKKTLRPLHKRESEQLHVSGSKKKSSALCGKGQSENPNQRNKPNLRT